ncbi:MAG: ABC transporter permease [Clostridia bacterium]|nr:ABC transporter permease [Clostridia bacterium]
MKIRRTRMKLSDYIRLSGLSIKARKKSTKNTIFGMSFGLILLIPMIFFAVAFYKDVSTQVNEVRLAASASIPLKNINDASASVAYREHSSDNDYVEGVSAYSKYSDLVEMEGLEDYMLAEYRLLSFLLDSRNQDVNLIIYDSDLTEESTTTISKSSENNNYYNENVRAMNSLKILFPELSSAALFTSAELQDYKAMTGKSNPLISLCNDGFDADTRGKGEIILSETMLKQWSIDKEDIAGKYISIAYPEFYEGGRLESYMNIDNDHYPNNDWVQANTGTQIQTYLCYQYKVVGIISEKYYDLPGRESESHVWVTAASVYYEEGRLDYVPIGYTINDTDNGRVLTFNMDMEDVLDKNIEGQYMLFLHSLADGYEETYQNNKQAYTLCKMQLSMQFDSFETLSEQLAEIKLILKDTYSEMSAARLSQLIANEIYIQFNMIDQIGMIIIIVFTAIGGILLFTNILNLLNTIRYSVESRKNYIGVMRAIGAKSKVIPRLYMFEILIIFFRTFIITAIFSTGLSFGIKYGLDYAFSYLGEIFSFTINFIYFPIAFGAAFLTTTLIGVMFALTASRVTAYQSILKTLYDEK